MPSKHGAAASCPQLRGRPRVTHQPAARGPSEEAETSQQKLVLWQDPLLRTGRGLLPGSRCLLLAGMCLSWGSATRMP